MESEQFGLTPYVGAGTARPTGLGRDQVCGGLAGKRCRTPGLLEGWLHLVAASAGILQRAAEFRQLGEAKKRCKRHQGVRPVSQLHTLTHTLRPRAKGL